MRGLEAGRASANNKTLGGHIPIGATERQPVTGDAEVIGAASITEDCERGRSKSFSPSTTGATIEGMEEVEGSATE